MSWDDLKYVLALCRERTAKNAAKYLKVNETTVSRRVRALEEQLGIRIFERVPTGVYPTPSGELILSAAKRIELETIELETELKGFEGQLRGDIKIATTDVFEELWAKDIAQFHNDYPQTTLTISTNNQLVDMNRREADVAIRLTATPPEYLLGKKVCEVFFAAYYSLEHSTKLSSNMSYSDLPWIGWEPPYDKATNRVIENYARGAHIPMRITSLGALARAISAGIGTSVLPCFLGDRNPNLVRIGTYFEGGAYIWILTHKQLKDTARVRIFREAAWTWGKRDQALIEGKNPMYDTISLRTT